MDATIIIVFDVIRIFEMVFSNAKLFLEKWEKKKHWKSSSTFAKLVVHGKVWQFADDKKESGLDSYVHEVMGDD